MLVGNWAGIIRQSEDLARIAHAKGKDAGFAWIKAAKADRHEKSGHLVIGNLPGRESAHHLRDVVGCKHSTFAFGFDQGQKLHLLKMSERAAKAMTDRGDYPTNLRAMMLALWPPKPKELLMIPLTLSCRAVLGT